MIRKSFPPTLCRLCGLIKSQGTNLCSTTAKRAGMLLRINKRLSKEVIHIAVGDGLPKFVCTDCEIVINDFSDFCKMVHDVQKKLEDEKLTFEENTEVDSASEQFVGVQLKASDVNCSEKNKATVSVGPDGKVECKLCQSYLEAVEHTTLHMVTHGIGTVICSCRMCGHQAELAHFLHSGSDRNSICCETCRFLPASNKTKTEAAGQKFHACKICSKVFKSNAHLQRHCIVHSGARPFLCEVCGSGFSQKSSLKLHVLSHTGLKPHKCEQCGQSFRFKGSLRSHIMSLHWPVTNTETNETIYQCDQCDRQFATVYKLRRHYRSHTGERPYECNRCGRLFSQTCNLKLHRKKHDEEDVSKSEQYSNPLLVTQAAPTAEQYISESDSTLLVESILQHPVVSLDDPENALSAIDTEFLQPSEKSSDHTPPYVSLNPEFLSLSANSENKKSTNELYTHFSHESLLYIDQPGNIPDTSATEGVTLPTFSSLQPVSSVGLPDLTH